MSGFGELKGEGLNGMRLFTVSSLRICKFWYAWCLSS